MYIYGVTSLMKCLLDEHAVGLYSVFYAILPLVRQRYILLQTIERPYSHNSLCWFRNISIIWTETVKTFRQHTQTFIISLYITIKQICGQIIKKLPHVLCYSIGTLHWQCFKLTGYCKDASAILAPGKFVLHSLKKSHGPKPWLVNVFSACIW